MLLAETFEENVKQCSVSRMANRHQNIKLIVLYDLYINKTWDNFLPEEKISNRPHMNVLNEDTTLSCI